MMPKYVEGVYMGKRIQFICLIIAGLLIIVSIILRTIRGSQDMLANFIAIVGLILLFCNKLRLNK